MSDFDIQYYLNCQHAEWLPISMNELAPYTDTFEEQTVDVYPIYRQCKKCKSIRLFRRIKISGRTSMTDYPDDTLYIPVNTRVPPRNGGKYVP